MEKIGTSSLWVERYRPQTMNDVIAPATVHKLFKEIKKTNEVPNLMFYGSAGLGKTSSAKAIANEMGMDLLYINGSLQTQVEVIRNDVMQFASTSSLMGGKKLVILDEMDRMSGNAQDSIKVLMEQMESNARFIICTNNLQKIIDPIHSRCQMISFNYGPKVQDEIMLNYFKRVCFILENEKVEYDKQSVATLVKNFFPDFRKTIGALQKFSSMNDGKITASVLAVSDNSYMSELIPAMKAGKFATVRKLCTEIDTSSFYTTFYKEIDSHIKDVSLLDIIPILGQYNYQHCSCVDSEVNLVACVTEIMKVAQWK